MDRMNNGHHHALLTDVQNGQAKLWVCQVFINAHLIHSFVWFVYEGSWIEFSRILISKIEEMKFMTKNSVC